jgi:sortase (surface protein transpeptidase)
MSEQIKPQRPSTRQYMETGRRPLVHTTRPTSRQTQSSVAPVHINHSENLNVTESKHSSSRPPGYNPALPRQSRSAVLARSIVQNEPKKRGIHLTEQTRFIVLIAIFSFVSLISGATAAYMGWQSRNEKSKHYDVLANTISEEEITVGLSEEYVSKSQKDAHETPMGTPRLLKIDNIGVYARMNRVTQLESGVLNSPSNIADVGWYTRTDGAVLIVGQTSGTTKAGVFKDINKLENGSIIELINTGTKTLKYKVASTELIDKQDINVTELTKSFDGSSPGLNIVAYNDLNGSLYSRSECLVVYAYEFHE